MIIKPHGGKLVNKQLSKGKKEKILKNLKKLKSLTLHEEQVKDAKNIGRGVYSPLTGFLKEDDFKSVVSKMRLSDGIVWPIPIVLDIDARAFNKVRNEKEILLIGTDKNPIALLKKPHIYNYDKKFFADNVFGTSDRGHPGVDSVYKMGNYLVGGEIELLDDSRQPFPELNFAPAETRKIFADKGRWSLYSTSDWGEED